MRADAVVSEAWRNLRTGTTRALLLASALALALGLLAVADLRSLVSIAQGADQFRSAGASTHVLTLAGGIDGQRCAALADLPVVHASGAVRDAPTIRLLALPSSDIPTFEVTPGFVGVVAKGPITDTGLALSQSLATTISAEPGTALETSDGSSVVRSVYPFPEDGRSTALSYAVLAPVPATGTFDACWAEVWPADDQTTNLMLLAAETVETGESPTLEQLNPRLGRTYDGQALIENRPTRYAGLAAVAAGAALGVMAVRIRRLEIAAALHTRVARPSITWQILIETAAWSFAAVIVLVPLLGVVALVGNPEPVRWYWGHALQVVMPGAGSAVLGALVATTLTREKHLFRYFKDR